MTMDAICGDTHLLIVIQVGGRAVMPISTNLIALMILLTTIANPYRNWHRNKSPLESQTMELLVAITNANAEIRLRVERASLR